MGPALMAGVVLVMTPDAMAEVVGLPLRVPNCQEAMMSTSASPKEGSASLWTQTMPVLPAVAALPTRSTVRCSAKPLTTAETHY